MAKCLSCGTPVPEGGRFCSACGTALSSDVLATRTVAAPGSRISSAPFQGRFAPGAVLGGRYRIIALLGKGGMGEVYRADDLVLEQPVALKFLPESVAHNEQALARFRNEVRMARQVSHPNVCRVYDLGEIGGLYFLSMEYVDGEDLGSLLRRIGRLPVDKGLEIARRLCAGLAAAHEKGVLHRDLKPSNVMLDGRGQVLLTDFGLAGLAGEIEGAEVRNGTPAYMAPEQLAGQEVSIRSDIYSLGLVLYEIFTGKQPFESETLAGLMREQRESAPLSPSTLVRDLDPMVERVILRCLQPKPSMRPANALAVAAALPGGDPLAAALAAGETPSPEMVAAAGQGEGLALPVAATLFLATLAAIAIACLLSYNAAALHLLQPEYPPDVLAQKGRDILARIGLGERRPADSAYGFWWNSGLLDYIRDHSTPAPRWDEVFANKPPVLEFWYRQSQSDMIPMEFHDDLLTPGIMGWMDPALVESGMINLVLDSQGRLHYLERIPPQREKPDGQPPAMDWNTLFAAAGLNPSQFQPAEPEWISLAAFDARKAWTGTWPGTTRPLRIEAAAWRGRPVYFSVIEPWTDANRSPRSGSTQDSITLALLGVIVVVVCLGAGLLARRNLTQNRSDRRGAWRLAFFFACVQMALWLARSHLTGGGAFGLFLFALCTSVFYGVVIWTVYVALEPYVRRHWPQTIISWSSVLIGRLRDPAVGRDVLIGAVAGAAIPLFGALLDLWVRHHGPWTPNLDPDGLLLGARGTLGLFLAALSRAVRETLFYFFLIFLLRALFRNQWVAAVAFAMLLSSLSFLSGGSHPILNGVAGFIVLGVFAFIVLRWGLLALAVAHVVSGVTGSASLVMDTSAWYFGNAVFLVAIAVALAVWGLRTSAKGSSFFTAASD